MIKNIETIKVIKVELTEEEKDTIIEANKIFGELCTTRTGCDGCMFFYNGCHKNVYDQAIYKILQEGLISKK